MGNEAYLLENSQVLRDRWTTDRQPVGELADGARPGAEQLEDLPPRRVAESVERVSVRLHLP